MLLVGVGNPGGSSYVQGSSSAYTTVKSGTGGLLIIYGDKINNKGDITSEGVTANNFTAGGGSSGGGSINIFYKTSCVNSGEGKFSVKGGDAAGSDTKGGPGGNGTVTKMQVK